MEQWWKALPRWLQVMVAGVTAAFTTITAFATAYPVIEPWLPALHVYVREYTDSETRKLRTIIEPMKLGVADLQVTLLRARKSAVDDQIFASEIEATKSDSPDELIKRRQRINKLKEEHDDLDEKIKSALKMRERE